MLKASDFHPVSLSDRDFFARHYELYPQLELHPERKYFDYVYLAFDLAELPGKKYLTIRHQLNKFQRTCSPLIEAIAEDNLGEIGDFLDLWCDWKDCDSDPMLAHEKEAVSFAISHFQEMKLSPGLAIRVNGKIGAISLFEGQNNDTALVHFEKGLPDCQGIYRAIKAEATGRGGGLLYFFIFRSQLSANPLAFLGDRGPIHH